jgi:hypothetical protein
MLVGKPVGAVVDVPSEAKVLLCSSPSVAVGGAVVVGAKVSWVGMSTVVASLVPVGMMLWGASVLVGRGVVTGADSDSVGIGTGTTAVVDSVESVAELALSVPLVTADSASPELVEDAEVSEAPVVAEESVVEDASDAPEVVVDASVAPEVVVAVSEVPEVIVAASEAPEVVVYASEAPDVVDALASVEVAEAVPDVASPDAVVLVTLSSPEVVIGTGTMGTVVLLASEAVSVELLEETLEGLRVGASVDCSTAVADTLAVDDASLAVAEVEMPVPTELSVALVVTGTGMAVVPSVPVDVLRL